MLFLPTKPVASPAAGTSILRINREDISFETLPGRVVLLSVTVHNDSDKPSEPSTMRVNAAPLGVFLPSREVGKVAVGKIPPRGKRVVKSAYAAPMSEGVSEREREKERGLRKASIRLLKSLGIQLPNEDLEVLPLESLMSRLMAGVLKVAWGLPDGCCWAGNFDVHVQGASAERHCQGPVQLLAGKPNGAAFRVGDGKEDRYRFQFLHDCETRNWEFELIKLTTGDWHPMTQTWVSFSIKPPEGTTQGCAAVEVTRESTGKSAMVEFGFGTDTIPPGCYIGR